MSSTMAKEEIENKEAATEEGGEAASGGAPTKSKKKLILGGGTASVIAAGALAAMMAVPSKNVRRVYEGPFSQSLFEEQFSCNIQEEGRTRYLQMSPVANYLAYDADYLTTRMTDMLFAPALHDKVFQVASRKSLDEIYGEINESTFMEEMADAINPVLFPVHIGAGTLPWDPDDVSGLRAGLSSAKNTFRGRFDEHVLHVNSTQGELWIDDGPRSSFEQGDLDVRVVTTEGSLLFIDTSRLTEDFVGELKVGVKGQVVQVLPIGLMVQ